MRSIESTARHESRYLELMYDIGLYSHELIEYF